MIFFICRTRKHVGDAAAEDRSDDAEHDRPENRHVHVHDVFRDNTGDKPNKKIPDQVKHAFSPSFVFRRPSTIGPALVIDSEFPIWTLAWQRRGCRGCVLLTFIQFVEFYGSEALALGKAGSRT
jgi:hypothetical protein